MIPKSWGFTESLVEKPFLEYNACFAFKGGYSSLHYHETKRNTFFVHEGALAIVSFTPSGEDIITLTRGESYHVERFIPHYFQALAPTTFFELYTGDIEKDDIIRISEGGLNNELTVDALRIIKRLKYEEFRKEIIKP